MIKLFVYIVVWIMYYIFFEIMLMFVNLYTEKYRKDITVINQELITEKNSLINIKKEIKTKKKWYLWLMMDLNRQNMNFKKEQNKVLKHMTNILKNDIVAYWYYCSTIKNEIITNDNKKFIVSFDNLKLNKYNFLIKKKIKSKLKKISSWQAVLIEWINKFYLENCNQNTWFKWLVKKYFEYDK